MSGGRKWLVRLALTALAVLLTSDSRRKVQDTLLKPKSKPEE